jgi:excisionase family DNA binding protein
MGACDLEIGVCGGANPPARIDAKQVTLTHDRRLSMTPLLSIPEAAKLLSISESTLRSHVSVGKIAHRRIGGAIRFTEGDIEEFVEGAKRGIRDSSPYVPSSSIPVLWVRTKEERARRRKTR